jgi:Family of unknown function (DUF6474)
VARGKKVPVVVDAVELSKAVKEPRLTPGKAKNLVGVAKIVAPAVLPVVTPYVIRAAAAARDGVDRYRARKLGVGVERLAEFTGHGGALHARIAGLAEALAELTEKVGADPVDSPDAAFAARGRRDLDKLAAAVRAAERMPAARRRAAHKAVSAELDVLEQELLRRLGV